MKVAKTKRTTYRVTIINLDGSVEERRFHSRNINVRGHVAPEPHWARTRPYKRLRQPCKYRSHFARRERRNARRKHDGIGPF